MANIDPDQSPRPQGLIWIRRRIFVASAAVMAQVQKDERGAAAVRALPGRHAVSVAYRTKLGRMLEGRVEDAFDHSSLRRLRGKVNLIFTSPPFPLVTKKRYGNKSGDEYLDWLRTLAPLLGDLLTPDGSIVLELGNAWVEGSPVMSTLPLEALLAFKKAGQFHLCQHIICHNPARLPSPAQWVNVKRARLKDAYTHVWWMARTKEPQADNRKVLLPYSNDMKSLLRTQHYNAGRRPSGHVISESGFLTDHGGSIAANVVEGEAVEQRIPRSLLRFSGTRWDANYRQYCLDHDLEIHPARMQMPLAAFFIQFLTKRRAMVVDPFAGSNTTGSAAEMLGRRWLSIEVNSKYVKGSKGRFARFNRAYSTSRSQIIDSASRLGGPG